jgi:3-isopropylmalate/(R)-2-methylmalate dehydratase small subunit
MNPTVKQITGLCAPMMINDIDTDIIIPAQHLTQTSKSGYGQHAFARLKQSDPDFVLNQQRYHHAKVLITGDNFGCGSSREHAVWAIQELGFQAIIAPSFADIFSNNARKNGLVLIEQAEVICQQWAQQAGTQDFYITIDLVAAEIITENHKYAFLINPFFQYCLTQGHSEIDYLLTHQSAIAKHHQKAHNRTLLMNFSGAPQ